MAVEWSSYLSLGNELIDNQHKEIIRRVNLFMEAINQGNGTQEVVEIIDFLEDYTINHFRAEEEAMITSNYPGRPSHEQEHAGFGNVVKNLRDKVELQGTTKVVVIQACNAMVEWLVTHILNTDKELAVYLRKQS